MSFDLSTVGYTTKAHALAFDWRTLATYALGIGAKRDELAFLYEHSPGGMKVYPTFAVSPAHASRSSTCSGSATPTWRWWSTAGRG